jgi:hypothetical protein
MRVLIVAAALVALGTSSASANLVCWYNAKGDYTGSDGDNSGRYPVGRATKGNGGDYAWGYAVASGPGSCPRKLPKH